MNSPAMAFSGAALSIIEDVVLVILPIGQLRGLKMGRGRKVIVGGMFGVGGL